MNQAALDARPSHIVSELELVPAILTVSATSIIGGGMKVSCATVGGNVVVQEIWDSDMATLGDLRAAVQLWLDGLKTPDASALYRCIVDEVKWHGSKKEGCHGFPVKEVRHGQLVRPTEVDAEWLTFDVKMIVGLDTKCGAHSHCYLPRKLYGVQCFKKAMASQLVSIDGPQLVGANTVQLNTLIPAVALEEPQTTESLSLPPQSSKPVFKLPAAVTQTLVFDEQDGINGQKQWHDVMEAKEVKVGWAGCVCGSGQSQCITS